MRSDASSVGEYISAAPSERRGTLDLLRGLCREELSGYEEAMRYGVPSYTRDGVVEVAFASQKAYVSLYVLRQAALQANAGRLGGFSVGKGCVRFRPNQQIDPDTVRALLKATAEDSGPVC